MPFTVDSAKLPDHVKKLPAKKKAQWVEVWNSSFKRCEDAGGDSCEQKAFAKANGAVAESIGDELVVLSLERDIGPIQESIDRFWNDEDQELPALMETLELLREQAIVKSEAGHKFPPEAFAHVPDPEKPSTWKCRLWETPESGVKRKQLDSVIKEANTALIKARLRAEYRGLKVAERNIPKAVMEDEPMERVIGREVVMIEEGAFDKKGELNITIIKPGFNRSKSRYYEKAMLARDKKIFENLNMYADHPTESEQRERPERSVRNIVARTGVVTEGRNGELRTRAKIVAPWFKERCALMAEQGLLKTLGVSIVAIGEGVKKEIEGTRTHLIERLVKGRSVDIVTDAGAGGFVELFESEDHDEDLNDIELVDADRLREVRPDLVEIIESAAQTKVVKETTDMSVELEKEVAELKEANTGLTAKNKEQQESLDAQAVKEAKADVEKLINEAELPKATKAKLTEQFKEATTADGVKEAIEIESKYLDELKETGAVKELGGDTGPVITVEESEKEEKVLYENAVKRFRKQGNTQEVAESMARDFVEGV